MTFGIKAKIATALFSLIVILASAFYIQYKWSSNKIAALNNELLVERIARQNAVIELANVRNQILKSVRNLETLNKLNTEITESAKRIQDHINNMNTDVYFNVENDPGAVERSVNKTTQDVIYELKTITTPD